MLRPLCLTLLLLVCTPARADFFVHHWENHYEGKPFATFSFLGTYYSSSGNFSAGGSLGPEPLNYTRFQSDLVLDQGLSEQLSFFGRMSWALIPGTGSRTATGYGLTDQTLGFSFRAL